MRIDVNEKQTSPTRIFTEATFMAVLAGTVAIAIGVGVHFGLDKAIDLKTLGAAVGISSALGGGIWILYRASTNGPALKEGLTKHDIEGTQNLINLGPKNKEDIIRYKLLNLIKKDDESEEMIYRKVAAELRKSPDDDILFNAYVSDLDDWEKDLKTEQQVLDD